MKNSHSAGGVVLNNLGQILVVNQRGKSWSLPKGHVEEGEDLLAAAQREIYEETGVKELEFVKELGKYERHPMLPPNNEDSKSEIKIIHMFLFKTSQNDLKPIDPYNPEAKWVERDDVAELLTHPKDKEFYSSIMQDLNS